MSYMEQQMQNYIESGLSEADRCYTKIAELEQRINQFIESISQLSNQVVDLQNTRDGLERQNDELVAQVAGRDALLNNLSKWIDQLPVPTKSATSWLMRIDGVMKESPAQCLRQIQVDAVLDAVKSCVVVECFGTKCISVRGLIQYAARVNAGEL